MTALDEIVEVFPGLRATAFTNVPHTLPVLDTHFPRFPVLPGVLILDTLAQVASVALGAAGRGPERWGLAEARRIRFRHYVTPGDRMETTVDIAEVTGDTALCTGTVRVAGRPVTTVRVLRMARRASQDAPPASEGTPA